MYTPYEGERGTSPSKNGKLPISKLNHPVYHRFLMKLCHSLWTRPRPKRELQYPRNLSYLTDVQWDIYDLQFVRSKDY